jgi:hypothetical protein
MKTRAARLWLCWLLSLPSLCGALPLTDYRAREGDTLDLFVAGSSAQDNSLQRLFRLLCAPDSLDVYRAGGGDVRLFFCRTRTGAGAVPGIAADQKVAFHKSSVSGSGSGVGPLIQRTPVEFLNVAEIRAHFDERCAPERRTAHPADGALTAYTEYECANPVPDREVPDAGISDVEPRFFLNAYHLAADAIGVLSVHNANAFIFGIPVNLRLRNALQAARFAADDPCHPANPHYLESVPGGQGARVPRGESEQCMPSLSRAQLAGIFSGRLTAWSQIVNPQGIALAAKGARNGQVAAPPGVQAPSDDRVYVCRRVDTSGTQAAYEMFFLNGRCAEGVRPFVASGTNVFLGSVSGDVKSCLTQLDQRNVWAVGILSTDSVESLKSDRWRFIKMDGVAPTLLNTFNGRWPFFVEQSYQWRGEHSEQPLQGPKLALMAKIGMQLGEPATIRDLDRGFRHAWGSAGVVALSDSGSTPPPRPGQGRPVDAAALDESPIIAVRHDSNNCSAVVAVYPTALP